MLRFADMLASGLARLGHEVRVVRPEPVVLKRSPSALRRADKWLGYVDKFLLFPGELRTLAHWADVVHICDHSNALYTSAVPGAVVTCHDLLAVRGALGEETDCPASGTGKVLQRWILAGLKRAGLVICDSGYTQQDLVRLTGGGTPSEVVLLGLNHDYRQLSPTAVRSTLAGYPALTEDVPYLLHVGSNLARKNKEGILRIFGRIAPEWPGRLVFAGPPLTPALWELASALGITERVVEAIDPDNAALEALYNGAFALVFPSRFEGFGWPPVEAQRCGCPVVASNATSLAEVLADSALVFPVEAEAAMAEALLSLTDPACRAQWVERGLENSKRFTVERMVADYARLYERVRR